MAVTLNFVVTFRGFATPALVSGATVEEATKYALTDFEAATGREGEISEILSIGDYEAKYPKTNMNALRAVPETFGPSGPKAASCRMGNLSAVADPPDAYRMQTVRLSGGPRHREAIGTINPDIDGEPLWVAIRPGEDGEGSSEATDVAAVEWLPRELISDEAGQTRGIRT